MDSRFGKLEKRVRWLTAAVAVLMGALVVLVSYGATRPIPDVIRSHGFEVINENGEVDAALFAGGMGGNLTLTFPPGIGEPKDMPSKLELGYEGISLYQRGTFLSEFRCLDAGGGADCAEIAKRFSARKIGNKFFVPLHHEIFRMAWQGNGGELLLFNTEGEQVAHLYVTGSGAAGLWVGDGQGTERVFESIAPE